MMNNMNMPGMGMPNMGGMMRPSREIYERGNFQVYKFQLKVRIVRLLEKRDMLDAFTCRSKVVEV